MQGRAGHEFIQRRSRVMDVKDNNINYLISECKRLLDNAENKAHTKWLRAYKEGHHMDYFPDDLRYLLELIKAIEAPNED